MRMKISEMKERAVKFSKEYANEAYEKGESQSFWNDFFGIFGIERRRVAKFEEQVKKQGGTSYIDLLWKGVLMVEHKSKGKNLSDALSQAVNYLPFLKKDEKPQHLIVSDFQKFQLYSLNEAKTNVDTSTFEEIALADLHQHLTSFNFILGLKQRSFTKENPQADIEAALRLGNLHDSLKANGYTGHQLEVLMVRILFCLFADNSGIFEKHSFLDLIEEYTEEDGERLGETLQQLFQVLNKEEHKRLKNLDIIFKNFPWVNGKLFEETIEISIFDKKMRDALLYCCGLDWSQISPAIFGSLFQSIMTDEDRRHLGAHYTTEENIKKIIYPLFMDSLYAEFDSKKNNPKTLHDFQKKLGSLKFFDPACGCGNFLVVAYRELRLLELEVLKYRYKKTKESFLNIEQIVYVDVHQFYGIEIEEFPSLVAQVALWLTDHQMNNLVSNEFGQTFNRLPLKISPTIVNANSLLIPWESIVPATQTSYVFGNPPFVGAKYMSETQRSEASAVLEEITNSGLLDYVSCWYKKSVDFIKNNPSVEVAFVSTNSICQGEQVGVLWKWMLQQGCVIHFAHQTFEWSSEAPGKAAVHCVIIAFSIQTSLAQEKRKQKLLFEYENIKSNPQVRVASNINPYLVEGENRLIESRSTPLCKTPKIGIGNKPIDNGEYLFDEEEKASFLEKEPKAKKYFRRWLGSEEFLNGSTRWCLWLGDCSPVELQSMPEAKKRVSAVKKYRLNSKSTPTQKLADKPTRFHVENMPTSNYLVIPEVSSFRRKYIPIGFEAPSTFASNLVKIVSNANLYHFGVLQSLMHNAWVRRFGGRLKSDYRYSIDIVYNNFPWPENVPAKNVVNIEVASQAVLDVRSQHEGSTLAQLYDPLLMPLELQKVHEQLDKAVDAAYGKKSFKSEDDRVSFLLALHRTYSDREE